MLEDKKINIRSDLVELFYKVYGNGAEAPSLNKTVNIIFEKALTGKLLELDEENQVMIKKLSERLNRNCNQALNIALSSVEFEIKETPKTRVTIDRGEKVKAQKPRKVNPVINY